MTRCAKERRVFFIEEPLFRSGITPHLTLDNSGSVVVVIPNLPKGISQDAIEHAQRDLIDALIARERIHDYVLWYYTPMALAFTRHLTPKAVVYDCMDELSAFKDAPAILRDREAELMRRASLVLTGGHSLYEAKRHAHANIHPFPSSVDATHFAQARQITIDPPDQEPIPHPRLGFFGVIDERMDLELVEGIADARPDWHVVMVGPVVKISQASLPQRPNLHYLGAKAYQELPAYIAGWDVALMPFARNEATQFISPTKTPEYMAAGKPVVSTSIRDVVRPYGQHGLVRIADKTTDFVRACMAAMTEDASERNTQADAFLRQTSWDGTWSQIRALVDDVLQEVDGGADAADGAAAM